MTTTKQLSTKEPMLIQRRVSCTCGQQFFLSYVTLIKLPSDTPVAHHIHHHDWNQTVNVMTLMGDGRVRQVSKKLPKKIYVTVICPDDCDCHDNKEDWDD